MEFSLSVTALPLNDTLVACSDPSPANGKPIFPVEASLPPFLRACEVPGDLSGNDAQPAGGAQRHTKLDKYLVERASLTKSRAQLYATS